MNISHLLHLHDMIKYGELIKKPKTEDDAIQTLCINIINANRTTTARLIINVSRAK